MLIETAEMCALELAGCRAVGPTNPVGSCRERGIPQYPTKALSLEGPSCCMEMQAVQKNQLRPSKLSVNRTRGRTGKFDAVGPVLPLSHSGSTLHLSL